MKVVNLLVVIVVSLGSVGSVRDTNRNLFPGTFWCGQGDAALDYNDVGYYKETDKCCRKHDHCPVAISAYSKDYGLDNSKSPLPKLHCDCDEEFRRCLRKVNSKTSSIVGKLYFSVMSTCIREDYPIKSCRRYRFRALTLRCVKYDVDETREKVYQYFDNPVYN